MSELVSTDVSNKTGLKHGYKTLQGEPKETEMQSSHFAGHDPTSLVSSDIGLKESKTDEDMSELVSTDVSNKNGLKRGSKCYKTLPDESNETETQSSRLEITTDRKCTDIYCLGVFIMFWIGMIIVASLAAEKGDKYLVSNGFQVDGRICGRPENAKPHAGVGIKFDKIFFPGIWVGKGFNYWSIELANSTVCTEKCPEQFEEFNVKLTNVDGTLTSMTMVSLYDSELIKVGPLKTCFIDVFNMTNSTNSTFGAFDDILSTNYDILSTKSLQKAVRGAVDAAPMIAVGAAICFFMIGIFFMVMRCRAACFLS